MNTCCTSALIAAYTAWLAPDGLEQPPEGFNLASGWICWFPGSTSNGRPRPCNGPIATLTFGRDQRGSETGFRASAKHLDDRLLVPRVAAEQAARPLAEAYKPTSAAAVARPLLASAPGAACWLPRPPPGGRAAFDGQHPGDAPDVEEIHERASECRRASQPPTPGRADLHLVDAGAIAVQYRVCPARFAS